MNETMPVAAKRMELIHFLFAFGWLNSTDFKKHVVTKRVSLQPASRKPCLTVVKKLCNFDFSVPYSHLKFLMNSLLDYDILRKNITC